jgi:Holliday junction resolvase
MTNYQKGARKERKLVNQARAHGLTALRSAGSHSPIDVVIIDSVHRIISLLQCKPDDFSQNKTNQLLQENAHLNGTYQVNFEVK